MNSNTRDEMTKILMRFHNEADREDTEGLVLQCLETAMNDIERLLAAYDKGAEERREASALVEENRRLRTVLENCNLHAKETSKKVIDLAEENRRLKKEVDGHLASSVNIYIGRGE